MIRRLGSRLLWSIFVLFFVTTATFILSRVVPADPAALAAGMGASPEQVQHLRHEMGLDRPLIQQYGAYISAIVLHGDLGESITTRDPVRSDLADYLPATVELIFIAFAIYLVLCIVLGLIASRTPRGAVDRSLQAIFMASSASPIFWVAMLMQLVFFSWLRWLPAAGRMSDFATPPPKVTGLYTVDAMLAGNFSMLGDVATHLVIPVTAVTLSMLGWGARTLRATLVEESAELYVRTGRALGFSHWQVLRRHVLRNSLVPFISVSGMQLGFMFGWVILVESVVQWPGIGLYAFDSFAALDYNAIMGVTLVSSVAFVIINLILDLVYPLVDPRMRESV